MQSDLKLQLRDTQPPLHEDRHLKHCLIYTVNDPKMMADFRGSMMKEFEMTDLGLMKYFLGIQVKQDKREMFISQEKYINDLLKKFQMRNCKSMTTPMATREKLRQDDGGKKVDASVYRSLVGSLLYLTHTRPDITQAVSMVSRFMNEPSNLHYAAAKRILWYLHGTRKLDIKYLKEKESALVGYIDSDWAGSKGNRKSSSAYVFCLGSNVISWSSKKQQTVALSSAKVEYTAAV